jgi:hypothetical protein
VSKTQTIHRRVRFHAGRRQTGVDENTPEKRSRGRVPRVTKLLALAIRMEHLVGARQVADYAELARLRDTSRARITQITNLTLLAPDIQEAILFLPRVHSGRDSITERQLRPIAAELDWARQREMWCQLQAKLPPRG